MESFSQFGEDVLVWQYFGHKKDGYFVEIGANAPFEFSQTWLLEKNGWKGLLAEPLSARSEELRKNRPGSRVCQVAVGAPRNCGTIVLSVPDDDMFAAVRLDGNATGSGRKETVELTTLNKLLSDAGNPRIDYLSIDVEGMELDVLEGFDLAKHRPPLILVEDHLKSLVVCRHLWKNGYRLVKRTGCNNWFVPQDSAFTMTTAAERFLLWKRIWIHTPLAVLRNRLRVLRRKLGFR